MSDKPGKELPKDYRQVVAHQVDALGWRYDSSRKGHPMLYPADRTQGGRAVPTTPSDVRSYRNFVSWVRRAGGEWPPGRGQ